MTEASSEVWQGEQHIYTIPASLRTTFDAAARTNDYGAWVSVGLSKDDQYLGRY